MKIEPCPYCGSSDVNIGRTSQSVSRFWVHCRTCYCDGPAKETVEQATDAHNRISRIVRAAEEWAKAEDEFDAAAKFGPVKRYEEAVDWANASYRALKDAVEGGRSDE